jgi:hypothetical protein
MPTSVLNPVNDASVIWEIVIGGDWRPLIVVEKWFFAIAFICEAKKGIAACQVQRHLGVNYRTAWHLCHRIRAAMLECPAVWSKPTKRTSGRADRVKANPTSRKTVRT